MTDTMRAVRIHEYGGPEKLVLEDVPVPKPVAGEVLVKIHSAAVNPVDWKIREGHLAGFLEHQLPLTLGWDFAGEIVALGENVTDWRVGDAVYSRCNISRNGTYAEYVVVDAAEIAAKPATADWNHAAAIPLVTLTAWQALYDIAQLSPGDRVLIHAGAGGVGMAGIQLAKLRGATVYTTCSTRNIDLVTALGADHVIDYTQADFASLTDLDVVFDTMGGDIQARSWSVLKTGGLLVSVVDAPDENIAQQHGVKSAFWFVQPNGQQLAEIASSYDQGKFKMPIDRTFTLDAIKEAHAASESHRTRGKLVLEICP